MALSVSALTAAAGNFLDMLPPQSAVAPGYTTADSVRARMAAMPLCPLEGLWRMAGDGALVAWRAIACRSCRVRASRPRSVWSW